MDINFIVANVAPMVAIVTCVGVAGWVLTTWMRIKNGYPLDGSSERVELLSSENAQLRAELGSIKDRLATVERIVTDDGHRLTQEIESLRLTKN